MVVMQHTRWEILQILKRGEGKTVEELASALSVAPMTVRQHLAILERDNLITSSESRRSVGRPPLLYSISPGAEDLFPKGYDRLSQRLLREISLLQSEDIAYLSEREKVALVFHRMADKQSGEYGSELLGTTLEERGEQVVALLRDREGMLSEWTKTEEGFQILDLNCPFRNVALEEPELCTWHLQVLTNTLQTEVLMHSCIAQGDVCCKFRVEPHARSE